MRVTARRIRRPLAWLLPLALVAGDAAAQRRPEPVELSEEDDGRVLRVPVGAEFAIRLSREVGDHWQWEMRPDPRFIPAGPPSTSGYGSRRGDREDRVFTIRVTRPGRFPLVFEKLSTFGGSRRSLDRRVTYMIEADGSGSPGHDAAAAPPLPPLGEKDAGRVIRVHADRELVILLPFASRLDQRWEVIASDNIGLAAPIAEQRDPGRGRNIFWLDSNNVVRLRPGGPGKAEVTLSYLPAPRGGPARQLRYRFVVD